MSTERMGKVGKDVMYIPIYTRCTYYSFTNTYIINNSYTMLQCSPQKPISQTAACPLNPQAKHPMGSTGWICVKSKWFRMFNIVEYMCLLCRTFVYEFGTRKLPITPLVYLVSEWKKKKCGRMQDINPIPRSVCSYWTERLLWLLKISSGKWKGFATITPMTQSRCTPPTCGSLKPCS